MVDRIIQVRASEKNPIETEVVVNSNEIDVITCMGSRYTVSSPLICIDSVLEKGLRYAFVGRPCDCTALRNYMKVNAEVESGIHFMISFLCAGIPSKEANLTLIRKTGINPNDCTSIEYRGDGWPGDVRVQDKNGNEQRIDYKTAWMDILGRDILYCCKFCFDSVGENSDISCGDFWYLNSEGQPDFCNHEGRNCVFAWTSKGKTLLDRMINEGVLINDKETIDSLKEAQSNHYLRRSTLFMRLIVMKTMGQTTPNYSFFELYKFSKFSTIKEKLSAVYGTIRRIKERRV